MTARLLTPHGVVRNGEVEPTLEKAKAQALAIRRATVAYGRTRWSRASTMIRHNTATIVRSLSGA